MSSRNQKIVESPVVKYLKWKTIFDENDNPIDGMFVSWNKETETEEKYELPFSFCLINDNCVTFRGYNEKTKEGVWSNEAYDKKHEVVIKNKNETLLTFKLGDYQANKDAVAGVNAKYNKVIYCGVEVAGEFQLYCITLGGSGLTGGVDMDNFDPSEKYHGYFNFTKAAGKQKLMSNYITVKEAVVKKKGKTKFFVPVFEVGQLITEDENNQLLELNNKLDAFHKYYYNKPKEEAVTEDAS